MATQSASGFAAELLCDGRGNVVYMEANNDFVEALSQAMHMSLGGLALSLQRYQADIGPVYVMNGLQGLRDELWDGDKGDMLPKKASMARQERQAEVKTSCQLCQQLQADAGFAAYMLQTYPTANYAHHVSYCCLGHSGRVKSADCLPAYQARRHCQLCNQQVQAFLQAYRQSGMQVARVADVPKGATPAIKSTVKFIVTNRLQVFENSSIRAIQLLGQAGVALDRIQTKTVTISQDRFKMMLGCMLLNSDSILTSCLTG